MKKSIDPHVSHSIDIIRGMSALGVIWGHTMYDVIDYPIEINGAFWVWIFLCVSGFLIAKGFVLGRYPTNISGFRHFYWNRALRIVPLYQLTLFLGLLIGSVSIFAQHSVGLILRQFFFYAPLNNTFLAGPLWTVAAEVQLYGFSAILIVFLLRFRTDLFLVFIMVLSLWGSIVCISWFGDNFAQPRTMLGNLQFFVFGMILAAGGVDKRLFVSRWVKVLLITCMVSLAWMSYNGQWFAMHLGLSDRVGHILAVIFWAGEGHPLGIGALCAMGVSAAALCGCSGGKLSSRWIGANFILRFLSWCGFYTYGIYCWHATALTMNYAWFHLDTGPFLFFLVFMFAITIAPISYRFFESYWFRYKYKSGNRYVSEKA